VTTLVLNKVFQVLDVLAGSESPQMTLAELTRETGIPKPTLHRLLVELSDRHVLARTDAGFCLGSRLFELGGQVAAYRSIREAALPHMQDLYEQTRYNISLGVLEGTEVLYLHKMRNHKREYGPSRVGSRLPSYSTATGKAMLAWAPRERILEVMRMGLRRLTPRTIVAPGLLVAQLKRVRESGISHDNEEAAVGVACIGAVIRDREGHAVAALAVGTSPTTLRSDYASRAASKAVCGTANAISEELARAEIDARSLALSG
jgi:IclR family acetate operon transcriptional repressor